MKKIGITGNIGSGKSQVTSYLLSRGYKVLDADALVAQIYNNPEFISKMIEVFGESIISIDDSQSLDKKIISSIVFNNHEKLKLLNETIGPYIKNKMDEAMEKYQKTEDIVFLDIPLLYEKKMQHDLDAVILVYCEDNERYKRASIRDKKTQEEIKRVDSFQINQSEKLEMADYIADNSTDISDLNNQIEEILNKIKIDKR